ncbi:MAG: DMT family transporter [Methanimicrococcus sp.]|nr:DMT family transporter [Methanimicrococcus sp.]
MTLSPLKKANMLMFLVVFFWGMSYLFTKQGLHTLPVFNFIVLRFGIGFIAAVLIFPRHFSKINKKTIKGGAILGFFLFLAIFGLNYGIQFTTISNAGFLGSMTVLFVPILSAIFFRKFPEKKIIAACLSAVIGIALLTLNSAAGVGLGDLVCLVAASTYASHIIITKRLNDTKGMDTLNLGISQLGFTALYALFFSIIFETPHLPTTTDAWISVLFLGILCSAFGFISQVVAQKYTTPAHVGLIFALEPVFAAFFASVFAGEKLFLIQIVGAAIVFMSVIFVQVDIKEWIQKRKTKKESV